MWLRVQMAISTLLSKTAEGRRPQCIGWSRPEPDSRLKKRRRRRR